VRETIAETPRARTLVLDLPGWPGHRAGQHVDVRLTAEDGYQAQRSYSIASAPDDPAVALTVERLDDGEVSPYLVDDVRAGDAFEVRGPIGGWFTWRAADGGPLALIGGGSGLVPLRAMLRHRAAAASDAAVRVLVSARSHDDLLYARELETLAAGGLTVTLTRRQPPGWTGPARRVDRDLLAQATWPPADAPRIYVCGPTSFVELVAAELLALGHDPTSLRLERFGATGA
jgi:ferredoxin-NADP reductase